MNTSLSILDGEIQELVRQNDMGTAFPPNCFIAMKAEFVEYESRRSLTVSFPVLEESLNPLRTMQGGFLVAAFDNVFGPLSYLAARCPCATLSLNTHFMRPVEPGDHLTVRGIVIARGVQVLQMTGEAFNSRDKLVATASATAIVIGSQSQSPS
ncbi:MAG: PaaI family thioesterase [Ignavibacteria bacterium]|nr:PaaI family thioesterase [Ignavibacteria bacterium]